MRRGWRRFQDETSVRRASQIKRAGEWDAAQALDRVVLDADERQRRRVVLTGENGTIFLLDLPKVATLRDGDGLVLDDGSIVGVAGKPEQLIEIGAASVHELARLAWHIGNRHTDVQVIGDRLRIRRDHVMEQMLRGLGARLTPLEAPFDPEPGAYGHGLGDARHGHGDGS
jgi:urease accessory protein